MHARLWGLILLVVLLSGCVGEVDMGTKNPNYHWEVMEVVVVIDESVVRLDESAAHQLEDAFYEWSEQTEMDVWVSVEYGVCDGKTEGVNCMFAADKEDPAEWGQATTVLSFYRDTNEITDADIVFYTNKDPWGFCDGCGGFNFKYAALHEVGHFFGLPHSDSPDDIMYPEVPWNYQSVPMISSGDVATAYSIYR